jgi:AP2 domain
MTYLVLSPCDACGRWPADHVRGRCIWCQPDQHLPTMACVRCGEREGTRGLRLCPACDELVMDVAERDQLPRRPYPPRRKDQMDSPEPERPTLALPGSPEKVAEMARRYQRREGLFHGADAGSAPADLVGALVEMCRREISGIRQRASGQRVRWVAEPWHDGRHHYIGTFDTEEDAIRAVRRWAGCHHSSARN